MKLTGWMTNMIDPVDTSGVLRPGTGHQPQMNATRGRTICKMNVVDRGSCKRIGSPVLLAAIVIWVQ